MTQTQNTGASGEPGATSFASFARDHRDAVEQHLRQFLSERRVEAEEISPRAVHLVDAVSSLTMRGGKRIRALIIGAVAEALGAEATRAVAPGAAMELLQSYLLIHDDWMDGDETRRGGPAAHVMLRDGAPDAHAADSLGVLAGDLAGTYAWQMMLSVGFPEGQRDEGLATFVRLQTEVYFGQQLDVLCDADVQRMHDLKTGSYTVAGPMRIGLCLGGATPTQRAALEGWAAPLGAAFQVRDDILGTYPAGNTGKPGDDLRRGKETALAAAAREHLGADALARFEALFGQPDASDEALAQVAADLEVCGARAALESRCQALLEQSSAALSGATFDEAGLNHLLALGRAIAIRTS